MREGMGIEGEDRGGLGMYVDGCWSVRNTEGKGGARGRLWVIGSWEGRDYYGITRLRDCDDGLRRGITEIRETWRRERREYPGTQRGLRYNGIIMVFTALTV